MLAQTNIHPPLIMCSSLHLYIYVLMHTPQARHSLLLSLAVVGALLSCLIARMVNGQKVTVTEKTAWRSAGRVSAVETMVLWYFRQKNAVGESNACTMPVSSHSCKGPMGMGVIEQMVSILITPAGESDMFRFWNPLQWMKKLEALRSVTTLICFKRR